MKPSQAQPWIASPFVDGAFILAPALITTGLVILFPQVFGAASDIPLWGWFVLIVCVDVAHVYSTLFRTYFDSEEFSARRALYTLVPLLGWMLGVMLYTAGSLVFWRVLAYLAVFHFIRQQYGFMMIYARKEADQARWRRGLDQAAIYTATLYPIAWWHTHLPREFEWFVAGDFYRASWTALDPILLAIYLVTLLAYAAKEIHAWRASGNFNLPKNLLLLGTALSWYVGIVGFNGDLPFTLTNVVAHGIPYMALVWIYSRRKAAARTDAPSGLAALLRPRVLGIIIFAVTVFVLAYVEEGFWDALVWRDHGPAFAWFAHLPKLADKATLAWVIPLLALPQITHYVLDGFIWRMKGGHTEWKNLTLRPEA